MGSCLPSTRGTQLRTRLPRQAADGSLLRLDDKNQSKEGTEHE